MSNIKIPPQDRTKIFTKVFGDVDPKHAVQKISKAKQKLLDLIAKNNLKSFYIDEQRDIYNRYQQIIVKLRKQGKKHS